jgi:hypothetical protein
MIKKIKEIKIYDFSTEAFCMPLPSPEKIEKLKKEFEFNINYDLFLNLTEISRQIYSHKMLFLKTPNESNKQEVFKQINLITTSILYQKYILQQILAKAGQAIRRDIITEIELYERKIQSELSPYKRTKLLTEIENDLKIEQPSFSLDFTNLSDIANHLENLTSSGDRLAYLNKISDDLLTKSKKCQGGRRSSFTLKKVLPCLIKIFKEGTGKEPDCCSNVYIDNGYTGTFFNFMTSFNKLLIEIDKNLILGTDRTIGQTISKYLAQQKPFLR